MLTTLFYSLLALDQTLAGLAAEYGHWMYGMLFLVIFAETGLVVFPLLPGDSILFIAGTVVASAGLNIHVLVGVLIAAAILGDTVNYSIGHYIGPKIFERPDSRWFKQEHLRRTQAFYDKYGGVTIIICRFVPIIRTFAPFLAGVAGMTYRRFLLLQRRRRRAVDRLARLRGLPVRQHPLGQGQPAVDRHRDHHRVADPGRVDVHQGTSRARTVARVG
jgi:membrane-associated protein